MSIQRKTFTVALAVAKAPNPGHPPIVALVLASRLVDSGVNVAGTDKTEVVYPALSAGNQTAAEALLAAGKAFLGEALEPDPIPAGIQKFCTITNVNFRPSDGRPLSVVGQKETRIYEDGLSIGAPTTEQAFPANPDGFSEENTETAFALIDELEAALPQVNELRAVRLAAISLATAQLPPPQSP